MGIKTFRDLEAFAKELGLDKKQFKLFRETLYKEGFTDNQIDELDMIDYSDILRPITINVLTEIETHVGKLIEEGDEEATKKFRLRLEKYADKLKALRVQFLKEH
jgi:hypothetical protein